MFGKANFVMARGYDDNKKYLNLDELKKDYVIRLTAKMRLMCCSSHRTEKPAERKNHYTCILHG